MRDTASLCPICLKKVPAHYDIEGNDVYLKKNCHVHGVFSTVVWRGDLEHWLRFPPWHEDTGSCPDRCGLCASHLQSTCCIEIEVTSRCNLSCAYCFEDGLAKEPSVSELYDLFQKFVSKGMTFLHLSGGEPTMRDDLPDIVDAAVRAGCQYIQLNSNGIRLCEDPPFVNKLAEAGLSFVFM
ncbi:Cyclic pyranopterin monophosphate synthase [Pelotomaculum schinkii]|uniref:Cyclic pyranopterin monophosphate synthase n=1 Tax=Pelotomaculum schinkii TaxID=78350 RepID=A0A4Y7R8C0_9FIRM|nr:radical SAM protein [Pelotomaculum schinkii]TEB05027.1 Cyclic pyranopterin monophosphate synthase [Pelotomaculum schinkii]